MSPAPLERCCPEVLAAIALHVAALTPLGPPADVARLARTSRRLHAALNLATDAALAAALFRAKFDTAAPARRLSPRWTTTTCLAAELRTRCAALRRIRARAFRRADLWTAYLMLLEDDGRNAAQLRDWAWIEVYLRDILLRRYAAPPGAPRPWFADAEGTALALWLMWLTTTRDDAARESDGIRQTIETVFLHPLIAAGHRYPSTYAPDAYFYLPLAPGTDGAAPHASGPPPRTRTLAHYGHALAVAAPPLAAGALLAAATRAEAAAARCAVPAHLPRTRAAALAAGQGGPTAEDVDEFLRRARARLPAEGAGAGAGSARWDAEWFRAVACGDVWGGEHALRGCVHRPGALSGAWAGRMLIPDTHAFLATVTDAVRADAAVPVVHAPLYLDLVEHHCVDADAPLAGGVDADGGDDILHAWLPRGVTVRHLEDAVEVVDDAGRAVRYETWRAGVGYAADGRARVAKGQAAARAEAEEELAPGDAGDGAGTYIDDDEEWEDTVAQVSSGVADILVTGETSARHGAAWGHFTVIGRVRPWDGLVALLRIPRAGNEHQGRWVFKGYVHGENVVGRWRDTATGLAVTGFEGGFVLGRIGS